MCSVAFMLSVKLCGISEANGSSTLIRTMKCNQKLNGLYIDTKILVKMSLKCNLTGLILKFGWGGGGGELMPFHERQRWFLIFTLITCVQNLNTIFLNRKEFNEYRILKSINKIRGNSFARSDCPATMTQSFISLPSFGSPSDREAAL